MFLYQDIYNLFLLTILEIILGIDNMVFISIALKDVDPNKYRRYSFYALSLALFARILMLIFISWIVHSNATIFGVSISRGVFLLGGIFLFYRAVQELCILFKSQQQTSHRTRKIVTYKKKGHIAKVILEIVFVDIIFSLDSILMAVAITDNNNIIIIAFSITILFMIFLSSHIIEIINKNMILKVMAFIFILVIAISIILRGLGIHFPKTLQYSILGIVVLVYYVRSYIIQRKRE
ncbi:MAG: hypothetical protein P857_371 [Candidatus Xenolissoclinum pacificiensis L6]|uniref:Integral membrane TerC family protein n=1 Tax=Candidatus Xenolissoclinum pacificiensis L6 TaxID=1401685 RepID=W2UZ81_9RICK|nr:MAG: hypothetical protein P857_371 [Candidatus Xenolissoclinum pacificiensis L6]